MKIFGGKVKALAQGLIQKAKTLYTTQATKVKEKVEIFTIPTSTSSRSSKQAISRRERNYKAFRKHKNKIAWISRKINYGIGR
jgi:hypothetical protein